MFCRRGGALILALLLPRLVSAQDTAAVAKRVTAVRVPNGSIVLDGKPDDAVWQTSPAITDFLQKQP